MKPSYYILRLRGDFVNRKSGDVLANADSPLTIGFSADCDIRLPLSDDGRDPFYLATILPRKGNEGWLLVKRTDEVSVSLAGRADIGYACQLNDGDVIMLDYLDRHYEITFRIRHDGKYDRAGIKTMVPDRRGWVYGLLAVMVLLIGAVSFFKSRGGFHPLDLVDVDERYHASVFLIRVDSVAWMQHDVDGDRLLRTLVPSNGDNIIGTAFLGPQGQLVTARHCVEYWIAEPLRLDTRIAQLDDDDIIRWAAEVETYNYCHPEDQCQFLRTYCSVYRPDAVTGEPVFSFTSTDTNVLMDKSRDELIPLDDFDTCFWWRSITPYFNRRDMELGDWLVVRGFSHRLDSLAIKSTPFQFASDEMLQTLASNKPLALMGFMENERSLAGMEVVSGSLHLWNAKTAGSENIVHRADITPGFSGGPVLVQWHDGYYVIGIVSRVDKKNSDLTLSVPVNQIDCSKNNKTLNL